MTYAIDFDGVLYKDGTLDRKICDRIDQLREAGDKVVLYTSRKANAFEEAREILKDVEFDDLVSGKYYADHYIDDRNMSIEEFLGCNKEKDKRSKMKDNREYRSFKIETRAAEDQKENDYIVKGYASTFSEYVLFNCDGIDYMEQIDEKAFDEADLSDVIFLYNHEGMVYARQKNGTLKVSVDEHGLYTEADLSSTEESRKLYEAIKAGLIDQMSFAFVVEDDDYDQKAHKRTIHRIGKVYDVSAVSIPANPSTDIGVATRSYFDGVIELERAERLDREKRISLAKAKYKYLTMEDIK